MSNLFTTLVSASFLLVAPTLALADDFTAADADGDGKLTMEEAKVMIPDLTAEEFESADEDGDGMLTAEEAQGLQE